MISNENRKIVYEDNRINSESYQTLRIIAFNDVYNIDEVKKKVKEEQQGNIFFLTFNLTEPFIYKQFFRIIFYTDIIRTSLQ